tara:strand:- start:176 stop:292 length:117 start_codon:yes stop_codon:yes gene_type:complete
MAISRSQMTKQIENPPQKKKFKKKKDKKKGKKYIIPFK